MSIIIDLLLLGIVAYCAWLGLKRGLVNSAFGIFSVIIAVFFGHLVGVVYGGEFSDMLKPFATGLVDGAITTVTAEYVENESINSEGDEDANKPPVVILTEEEKSDVYSVSFAALRQIGVGEKSADLIATEVAKEEAVVGQEMSIELTAQLCNKLSYIMVVAIIFAIVAIIAAIIGNVLNIYFKLPNLETVNKISGSVLGAVKGIIIIMFVACLCRYFGLILGQETISRTWLLELLINSNKLASILGV